MRFAPMLTHFLRDGKYAGDRIMLEDTVRECQRELRALLAVARVADRHTNPHEVCIACHPKIRAALDCLKRASKDEP